MKKGIGFGLIFVLVAVTASSLILGERVDLGKFAAHKFGGSPALSDRETVCIASNSEIEKVLRATDDYPTWSSDAKRRSAMIATFDCFRSRYYQGLRSHGASHCTAETEMVWMRRELQKDLLWFGTVNSPRSNQIRSAMQADEKACETLSPAH